MLYENVIYTIIFFMLLYLIIQLNNYIVNKIFFPSSFLQFNEKNFPAFIEEVMEYGQIAVYIKPFKRYTIIDKTFYLFFEDFNILLVHLNDEYFAGIVPNMNFTIVKMLPINKTLEQLENNYILYISKSKEFIYIFVHDEKNKPVMEILYNNKTKKMFKIEIKNIFRGKKIEYYQKLGKLKKIKNFKQLLEAFDIDK